jgi:hypothetical protein
MTATPSWERVLDEWHYRYRAAHNIGASEWLSLPQRSMLAEQSHRVIRHRWADAAHGPEIALELCSHPLHFLTSVARLVRYHFYSSPTSPHERLDVKRMARPPRPHRELRPNGLTQDSLAPHPQLHQCAEGRHGPIVELLFNQGQVREPLYQAKDGLLSFDTGQIGGRRFPAVRIARWSRPAWCRCLADPDPCAELCNVMHQRASVYNTARHGASSSRPCGAGRLAST